MARAHPHNAPAGLPAQLAGEPPPRRRRLALRVTAGIVLVIALSAAATIVIAKNELHGLVRALQQTGKSVKIAPSVLASSYRGGPQTLLLVGTDQRKPPHQGSSSIVLPHANEMMLVRIDPTRPTISILSIPRELSVNITTPYGEELPEQRFTSAYTFGWLDSKSKHSVSGGIKLMLEAIKKEIGVSVNNVFVIDFKQFEHAIQELGCLYFPVDKRYYHNNAEPGAEQYMNINLHPGYQNLCGHQALTYVANRHESTSLIRDARDQRFVLEAKNEFGGSLFEDREKFEHILAKNVRTTLKAGAAGEEEILNLLYLLVESAGKPVRQVHFPIKETGFSRSGQAIDIATPEEIHEAVTKFLGGTGKITGARLNKALSTVKARRRTARKQSAHKGSHRRNTLPEASMAPTSEEALSKARQTAAHLPFPLEYPWIRNAYAESEPDELRPYTLHSPNHVGHPSYVIVISRGLVGQYYDIEGTTWTEPPILSKPTQEVSIGKRTYLLFESGEHIMTVAWREFGAAYWVENTLSNNLSPRQMLEIAEETQPVGKAVTRAPIRRAKAAEAALHVSAATPTATSSNAKLALIVGAVSIVALLLLAVLVLLRRRDLRELRAQIADTLALEAHHGRLAGAAAGGGRAPGAVLGARQGESRGGPGRALGAGLLVIVLAAAAGGLIATANSSASRTSSSSAAASIPVAVFNATATAGAAHHVAALLAAKHSRVAKVGNAAAGGGATPESARESHIRGARIYFPPGDRKQAEQVARKLPGLKSALAPIDPQVRRLVGGRREIVIVLT